jgi:hypothetical protein
MTEFELLTAADIPVMQGLARTALPTAAEEFALKRWAAHGYETDLTALGDDGDWTQLNERDLTDVEQPGLPAGFRFRTADEAGPEAAVRAHADAWAPTAYTAQSYEDVRQTTAYRGDLHVLLEAPDGTMASSTIMWLDQANKTVEFKPVGTHPDYRRLGRELRTDRSGSHCCPGQVGRVDVLAAAGVVAATASCGSWVTIVALVPPAGLVVPPV